MNDDSALIDRGEGFSALFIIANVCLGREKAIDLSESILRMYGEQFKNYEKEFKNV